MDHSPLKILILYLHIDIINQYVPTYKVIIPINLYFINLMVAKIMRTQVLCYDIFIYIRVARVNSIPIGGRLN